MKEIGVLTRDQVGVCIDVETDEHGCYMGKFIRIRVLIDISKPLHHGKRIRLGIDPSIYWVDFKYERLLEFIFICGGVGRAQKDCFDEKAIDYKLPVILPKI